MEGECTKTIVAYAVKLISDLQVNATLYQIQKTGNMSVLLVMEKGSLMVSTHITLQDAITIRDVLNEIIEKSKEI
jgi:hypothetical protein